MTYKGEISMGLIKAGVGAVGGVLADQWEEYFYCEALSSDILVTKGLKKTSKRSSNTKGEENIISNGSLIAIADGQCMIIVEQGKVVEVCAEPGEFVYDTSSEPSIFYGNLGNSIVDTFKNIGGRFKFGGIPAKDQRIYYVNTKEILGNKYGTANPVPFRVVDTNIGLDIDITVRCNGEYSYKILDPILFYTNVCGNIIEEYHRSEIDSMLKTELLTALQPAFAKISALGIRYSALPGHTTEVADALNEVLSAKWSALRGLAISSFGINSISASEEDEAMIKELQRNAALRNPNMAAATLVAAQAQAMQDAAKNEGGMGAFMGFAGMNMAQNAGNNAQDLFAMGQQEQTPKENIGNWTCQCGTTNTGKFCTNCGGAKPQTTNWACTCGTTNTGKFCTNCGKAKPAQFKCNKCGWIPTDPNNIPKFCPECGDVFDDNDKI